MQLTDLTYALLRDLLNQRLGLSYPERKRADLELALGMICRAAGLESLEKLYQRLLDDDPLWDAVVTQLTIGETYFFRHSSQFAMLRQHLLPEIIGRRAPIRTLRIWSAGCATGEEPYSVAMTLAEQPGLSQDWQTSILATDINPEFLGRAQEALYGSWSFRETTDEQRARFFQPEGQRWRLAPEIRRMVRFARLNLAEPSYPSVATNTCALDVIICRNVTIYFDEATTRRIIERFYDALTPGGWLIVGHSEPQARLYQRFEVHNFPDTVVYRKPLQAPLYAYDPASGTFSAGSAPILRPGALPAAAPAPRSRPQTVAA
ncbi:MAG TPA: protein-glutamate O-methyltransferase CheR, partial [Herpetosiphonaceae bacterium]